MALSRGWGPRRWTHTAAVRAVLGGQMPLREQVIMRRVQVAVGALISLFGAACIIDDGDGACGKNQRRVTGNSSYYCECETGFILQGSTCVACGVNETSQDGRCVCQAGFARASAEEQCAMSSFGAACTTNAQCSGSSPTCLKGSGGSGFCTNACASSSDCQLGYLCDAYDGQKVCSKAPAGYSDACTASSECTKEATYCEAIQSKVCLVTCGKSAPCPGDWSCCEISLLGVAICVEPKGLMSGMCPGGGKLVTP